MLIICVATLSVILVGFIYYKLKKKFNYWIDKGINGPKPNIIFGNFKETYLKTLSLPETFLNIYLKYKTYPVVGIYSFFKPVLLINEPGYIEKILKTDFSCFTDRVSSDYAERDVMHRNIFNLNGPHWKAMRNNISPVFTSLKLKSMMTQMESCFENTSNYIDENISKEIDMKEISSIYSHDVIVQCLFGIESKELSRPGTRFRRMQTEFFNVTALKLIYIALLETFPRISALLKLTYFSNKTVDYFKNLVETTLYQRVGKKSERKDLIQLLLKMKEKRTIDIYEWEHSQDDDHIDHAIPIDTVQVTDELLESQAMIFFHTGVESLVSSLTLAMFELSRCPHVLTRLRQEIDSTSAIYGITQKSLHTMTYLDMCIKETLRLYPIVPQISRKCSKRYELPCGLVVEPGETVIIPVYAVHRDEEYFPEPDLFKPDRFLEDPPTYTYLPFGEGPRICFAMKFVMTELKVGLCKLIQEYDFKLSSKTELPVNFTKWSPFIKPSNNIWMNFTKRNKI